MQFAFYARTASESSGFHKQPCLEERATCSAAFYVGVISLLKESRESYPVVVMRLFLSERQIHSWLALI